MENNRSCWHNQRGKDPWVDPRALPGLGDAAARLAPLRLVLAEFDSEANHRPIRQRWRAQSIIPAQPRRGVPQGTLRGQMYRNFPQKPYGPRAKVETVFSVVKRKLSARAPGRRLVLQVRQALLLGLTYNLYRLRLRSTRRGCQQSHLKFLCFQQGRKITALVLGWVEDSVVRSDSRGFGVAEASSKCGVASIVW